MNLPKWFDQSIHHDLNYLLTLCCRYTAHPTADLLRAMTILETNIQADISKANSSYTDKLVRDFAVPNKSKIYSNIWPISKHGQQPTNMLFKDISVSSDLEKENIFNKYFFSVY